VHYQSHSPCLVGRLLHNRHRKHANIAASLNSIRRRIQEAESGSSVPNRAEYVWRYTYSNVGVVDSNVDKFATFQGNLAKFGGFNQVQILKSGRFLLNFADFADKSARFGEVRIFSLCRILERW
jgi:hypothetical protein